MQGRYDERTALDDEFELQYEQYRLRIYRTILGIVMDATVAEDLTQETFERAYRWYRRHRDITSMGAWLHRIAVNAAISHHRRQNLARLLPLRLFLGPPTSGLESVETKSLAQRALAVLTPKLRATVILHFYLGMTREEIAQTLGIPPGTVASRLGAAIQTMRNTLLESGRKDLPERLKGNASQRT
jgi:RNA polymerase sigma factor (sigma-70 family)